jgi:hypothetical protein
MIRLGPARNRASSAVSAAITEALTITYGSAHRGDG